MHRKLPLVGAAWALALSGFFNGQALAQSRQQHELLRQARDASSLIDGTWVLQQRLTPSGKPHKQPLYGEFTVRLGVDEGASSRLRTSGSSGPLATGSYVGKEKGVLDSLMSEYDMASARPVGPVIQSTGDEASPGENKDVLFEMNGSSDLELSINPQSPEAVTLVYRNLELKGTYGVFRQGIRSSRMPTTFKRSDTGLLFFRRPTLSLVNAILSASDVEMPPNAQGPGSPGDKSHDIVRHIIRGDRMEITYGNGGRDVWVKKRTAAEN